ncbi:uncharacterized protein BCR38DRAFT_171061 [Pseudomassariella vexata]|uniref:Uncharacterized protein n=1 Tax=Pseudomassariella vexata TaxID=1141098 RepID=A0A1Y2E387_9PEZI|nr:uncharacterized protein BCR38DRAFT_171061 [Pseudomassariella vexata]ORY66008.1 hypothetical protein BCR38DRAFT_171061 [Pseudomassariella vexata]
MGQHSYVSICVLFISACRQRQFQLTASQVLHTLQHVVRHMSATELCRVQGCRSLVVASNPISARSRLSILVVVWYNYGIVILGALFVNIHTARTVSVTSHTTIWGLFPGDWPTAGHVNPSESLAVRTKIMWSVL